ncbi:MAG: TIGR03936 family radical SAM-associated protein [Bacillota bacterium]|nr:TIGR03936 family radical SAM-associated protein [Bacillota bacterium]
MLNARMRFSKTGNARYLSHLDTMHLFQRTFLRAGLPLRYTEGFNPHPYVSVLLPLPTSFAGLDEIVDFDLTEDIPAELVLDKINAALPLGFCATELCEALDKSREIAYASYRIELFLDETAEKIIEILKKNTIMILKKSKSGENEVNLKDYLAKASAYSENGKIYIDAVISAGNKNLNPEYLVNALSSELGLKKVPDALYTRTAILKENLKTFR